MPVTINASTSSGLVQSADTSGQIELQTNGTTVATVNTSNNVQFRSSISVGNATPTTSGAGITFPATQSASTDANTLDDYEEGTWTPTVTSGTGSITTYSITTAKYTKIGNFVFIDLVIYVANIGTAGGNCTFTLPFTSATACGVYGREYNNAGYGLQGLINGTTATGYVFNTKTDNGSAWTGGNGVAFGIGCMYPIS